MRMKPKITIGKNHQSITLNTLKNELKNHYIFISSQLNNCTYY